MPASFVEVIDVLVDVVMRYTGPKSAPGDIRQGDLVFWNPSELVFMTIEARGHTSSLCVVMVVALVLKMLLCTWRVNCSHMVG